MCVLRSFCVQLDGEVVVPRDSVVVNGRWIFDWMNNSIERRDDKTTNRKGELEGSMTNFLKLNTRIGGLVVWWWLGWWLLPGSSLQHSLQQQQAEPIRCDIIQASHREMWSISGQHVLRDSGPHVSYNGKDSIIYIYDIERTNFRCEIHIRTRTTLWEEMVNSSWMLSSTGIVAWNTGTWTRNTL